MNEKPLSTRLLGFAALPMAKKCLLLSTVLRVMVVKANLRFRSPAIYAGLLVENSPQEDFKLETVSVYRWAVQAAGTLNRGWSNCLVQSIALTQLLRAHRIPAVLHIGSRIDELSQFDAHAWVTVGKETVLDGRQNPDYEALRACQ